MSTALGRVIAVAHPLALSIAWLVAVFASTGTPLWALWRPLAIVVMLAVAVQVVLTAAIRRPGVAAVVTSGVLMTMASVWVIALPILVLFGWLVLVNMLRALRHREAVPLSFLGRASANLGFASIVLAALAIGQAATSGAFWSGAHEGATEVAATNAPDIYLVLLDGYPRADILSSRFDIDNTAFTSELEARGFDVAARSQSNYSITWLTVASMFRMDYVQDLPETRDLPVLGPAQYRALGQLMNAAPVLSDLRAHGYTIVSSASSFPDIALTNADIYFESVGPTRFEEQLLEKSTVATVLDRLMRGWLAEEHRRAIATSLERPREVATRSDSRPVFMFDHVFSPHTPFVFNADGSPRDLQACFPRTCSLDEPTLGYLRMSLTEYRDGLEQHLAYLNRETLAVVDSLISARPDAVVVLFSDHGTRYDKRADPSEAVSNFFAARTPGAADLFGDDPSPVNLLPTVLNRYLGTDYEVHAFRSWISYDAPLDLKPLGQ